MMGDFKICTYPEFRPLCSDDAAPAPIHRAAVGGTLKYVDEGVEVALLDVSSTVLGVILNCEWIS